MQYQNNAALDYDFALFEDNLQPKRKNNDLKVVKNDNYKKIQRAKNLEHCVFVAKCIVVVASIIFFLAIKAQTAQIVAQINTLDAQIPTINSDYDYYNNYMARSVTLKEIEDYAISQGMVKMDPSQIVYIQLNEENAVVMNPTRFQKIINNIKSRF